MAKSDHQSTPSKSTGTAHNKPPPATLMQWKAQAYLYAMREVTDYYQP